MKTSRRTIITAAAVLACAAPAASARPAIDAGSAQPPVAQPATSASIAAHHEQMSQQQYVASHRPRAAEPRIDGTTDTDSHFPLTIVLVGLSVPLGIGLASSLAKPARAHVGHRRPPANVA